MGVQKTLDRQSNRKQANKQNTEGDITIHDFKLYYKTKHMGQGNGIEDSGISPHTNKLPAF